MSSAATEPDIGQIADNVAAETSRELSLGSHELPQAVRDAHDDLRAALSDKVGAGRQLNADIAELYAKRDLIPGHGMQRLRGEAVAAARANGSEADSRARRSLETLRTALTDAAMPQFDPARESLARQELATAIGDARGNAATVQAMRIAGHGSGEAIAALLSSFGQTLLAARGLEGRDLTDTLANVRKIAAANAVERGATKREQIAGKALRGLDRFGAANAAAGNYINHAANKAW